MDAETPESLHAPARASPAAAAPSAPALSHRDVTRIIGGIILAMLLGALDQTIVATAMPTIGRELGDPEHLPWVVTAYLLAATTVTPLYGKLSDIHGRRVTLLAAITIFVAGSVACALAPSMLALVGARGLQGLGGGGLISLAQTIIADVVAPRERARYQGYIAGVFVTASLVGPVLGGVFAEHLHWSAIFWINVPLGALAFWITGAALRRLPRHERPHRLDWLGAALLTGATVALMLGLSWGGVRHPWASAPVLGLFALSGGLWVLLMIRLRAAAEPLIPANVLRDPVVRAGTLAATFGMGTYIGLTIYVPVFFEGVLGLSAAGSGLAVIPLMLGTVAGATLSGRAMARLTHYRRLPVAGLVVAILGTALLARDPAGLPFWAVEVILAVLSMGLGTLLPVTTVAVQNAVAAHELGTATGVMNLFRQLGGALAVAVLGAIVVAGGRGAAGGSPEEMAHLAGGDAGVFAAVFWAAAGGFALALAALLFMAERPLRGDQERAAGAAAAD